MKKFLLGVLGLAGMAAPALAADLPVKAPPPPPMIPIFNWSGFYIGGNAGWARSENCWEIITLDEFGCRDRSGGLIGGQIGYRWQLPDNHFVFGLEAQGDWANLSASRVSVLNPDFTLHAKIDGIGLFTGQFGFAWDMWLWYVKAGAAVTGSNLTISSTATGADLASASSTRWGGVVGTGFEYAFSPNWSVGFEYDHLFMGGSDLSFTVLGGAAAPAPVNVLSRVSQTVDMFTVRFNYRFGGFGGPVARY